jgi:hypothetical protein
MHIDELPMSYQGSLTHLMSKAFDPADVFGSDDEGFLEDTYLGKKGCQNYIPRANTGKNPPDLCP